MNGHWISIEPVEERSWGRQLQIAVDRTSPQPTFVTLPIIGLKGIWIVCILCG